MFEVRIEPALDGTQLVRLVRENGKLSTAAFFPLVPQQQSNTLPAAITGYVARLPDGKSYRLPCDVLVPGPLPPLQALLSGADLSSLSMQFDRTIIDRRTGIITARPVRTYNDKGVHLSDYAVSYGTVDIGIVERIPRGDHPTRFKVFEASIKKAVNYLRFLSGRS